MKSVELNIRNVTGCASFSTVFSVFGSDWSSFFWPYVASSSTGSGQMLKPGRYYIIILRLISLVFDVGLYLSHNPVHHRSNSWALTLATGNKVSVTSVDVKLGGFQVRMVCRWAFRLMAYLSTQDSLPTVSFFECAVLSRTTMTWAAGCIFPNVITEEPRIWY